MSRSTAEWIDIFNAGLLGFILSCMIIICTFYRHHIRSRLGKAAFLVMIALVIRVMTTIRLETSNPRLCQIWVFLRGTLMPYIITSLNLFSCTEMYIGIQRAKNFGHRSKSSYLWHVVLQTFNVTACVMIGSVNSGIIDQHGFCLLYRSPDISMGLIGAITMAGVTGSMIQCVIMIFQGSVFTKMPDVRQLFRRIIISMLLLNVATSSAFLEAALVEWQDYKTVFFSLCIVWNTANTLWIIGYLIYVRKKCTNHLFLPGGSTNGFRAWSESALVTDRDIANQSS